jgi:hypothetical protein
MTIIRHKKKHWVNGRDRTLANVYMTKIFQVVIEKNVGE